MRFSAVSRMHDETARPAPTSSQHDPCVSPTTNRRGEGTVRDDAGYTTLAGCPMAHSARIHDRWKGRSPRSLQLAANPPTPPFCASP
jgi:hypothetical protein